MCTAISYVTKVHYFGRNLDLDKGFGEGVVITPRHFPLPFRCRDSLTRHYAIIGMGTIVENYPLYFDATNEKGLSMAALNFPGNAYYGSYNEGKNNIAPFEVIPLILGSCDTIEKAIKLLQTIHIANIQFREDFPVTPLHWLIADGKKSIVLESVRQETHSHGNIPFPTNGPCHEDNTSNSKSASVIRLYHNPYRVLTNSPSFPFHRDNIQQYMGLHESLSENQLSQRLPLENISLGFGAMGLPGDFSSISRFVKAVFVKEKSPRDLDEAQSVTQFFHILQSVAMPKGCVRMENSSFEYTRYSCCCNTDTQTYYYNTYDNLSIRQVSLSDHDLNSNQLLFSTPI